MAPRPTLAVTQAELDVLRVLWDNGPSTLGEVYAHLNQSYEYTSMQTMLDRMVAKNLISRDKSTRPARHRAKASRSRAMKHFLSILTDKVCDGAAPLVTQLFRDSRFTSEELAEIKTLIERAEQRTKEND